MNALISVFYKDNVLELAKALKDKGYNIISSGGTFKHLKENGIEVKSVEDVTHFPEMLDGRVKTLHPNIHGGLLARRDDKNHMDTIKNHNIETIDVICVNLYPFEDKLKENLSFDEMIEFIDIGGPSMLRSAAKNFKSVSVLSNTNQYEEFITRLKNDDITPEYNLKLSMEVFKLTSKYDGQISKYLEDKLNSNTNHNIDSSLTDDNISKRNIENHDSILSVDDKVESFKDSLTIKLKKVSDLRYGENPHQKGAFYKIEGSTGYMTDYEKLNGKDLGYINYKDIESAWAICNEFDEPACAAVKHNTPCGIAIGKDAKDAYVKTYQCDSMSIFGGIVGLNVEVDLQTAKEMTKIMLHCVCAPSFTDEALEELKKKKNLIIFKMNSKPQNKLSFITSEGGVLIQEIDKSLYDSLEFVTKAKPSEEDLKELEFAMKCVKFVKSNAIVVTKDRMALGIGGGYVNRIDAAKYALEHARGSHCLASDAFFPFSDVVEEAHKYGIKCIIQPGGSVNDKLSIEKCDELGIAMVFTGQRHFRH